MAIVGQTFGEKHPAVIEHVTVYYEKGRYGGWPANHGIWSWGNEILVGFGRGYYKDLGERHHLDREKPEEHWLARSLDGGQTWTWENPSEQGALVPQGEALLAKPVPGLDIPPAKDFEGEIDFTHPGLAFVTTMYSVVEGESQFFYSYDRGKTWNGPYRFPDMGLKSIHARTNYIINGKRDCMAFLSGQPPTGPDRSFMARTTDGGKTWRLVSWISENDRGIMPSAARVSPTEIFAAVRRKEGEHGWISGHLSNDNGETWEKVSDPAEDLGDGNPPMVLRLQDGRICVTYGDRGNYHICARLSNDGGRTWCPEIILRDDGGSHDMGYTRSVQRPDGKVVTVYYFWEQKTGPERYIAATIWDPAKTPQ
ncbi:MAG: sialidase family protein [bacterium]